MRISSKNPESTREGPKEGLVASDRQFPQNKYPAQSAFRLPSRSFKVKTHPVERDSDINDCLADSKEFAVHPCNQPHYTL